MQSIKLFICVAIVTMPLVGCVEPAQQSTNQEFLKMEPNNESDSGSSSVGAEASAKTPTTSEAPETLETTVTTANKESAAVVYGDRFPKVTAVKATPARNNRWRFSVTLSSPYDSPQRYADAWRVLDDQDNELGIRNLGHDHASEQPFTRSQAIELPAGTMAVFVEGRDQANGWSGQRFEFTLPAAP